jgi:hypothetical protein
MKYIKLNDMIDIAKKHKASKALIKELQDYVDNTCIITWCIQDIMEYAEELGARCTRKQAIKILNLMEREHDANTGVCWDTIESYLSDI